MRDGSVTTEVVQMCNFASAKATEWVPIRPGTDAAMALAMVNIIVNDLGVWDAEYLATKTNAPYLIGLDGCYVRDPDTMSLSELFPLSMSGPTMASKDQETIWSQFKLPYRPEVMLNYGANSLMSVGNSETVAETLKKIPFIVSFEIVLTEFSEFADIILPDTGYLESLDSRPNVPFIFNHPAGLGNWSWPIKQPVVPPAGQRRPTPEILLELADRIGINEEINATFNTHLKLDGPHRLTFKQRYTYEEICDRELQLHFGAERGLDWFKEHGVITWTKRVEEVCRRSFLNVRVPIYAEVALKAASKCEMGK